MHTIRHSVVAAAVMLALGASLAWAQSNAKEIMARPAGELVELLNSPTASTFEKAKACQQLAVVGTKDAVLALVALLSDEKLNAYARMALENIPDPAVDEALREATKTLKGKALASVLLSLGQRRDAKAVELMTALLADKDLEVASAAACGLGRIGTLETAKALLAVLDNDDALSVRQPVAEASLACAERLEATGEKELAIGVYNGLLTHGSLKAPPEKKMPKPVLTAAIHGLFRLQPERQGSHLTPLLQSVDKDTFNTALSVARELPGEGVTALLIAELPKQPAERQALLLRAIGDRKGQVPLAVFIDATKNPAKEVRAAAIDVLGLRGDASVVPVLLDTATAGGDVALNAKAALLALQGREIDTLLVGRLASADAKTKTVLFELIGGRRIAAAEPMVREALANQDNAVRAAAIAALAQLIKLEDLELLTSRVLAANSPAETAVLQESLQVAAMRMSDIDGCAKKLAACLDQASPAKREFLLNLLGRLGGKQALATVVEYTKREDAATKDAATKVLGEWASADAAPALLDLAKSDKEEKYRLRALRGYIRIARQLQLTPDERIAMYQTAVGMAQRNDERQIALEILLRAPCTKSLDLALAEMEKPELKQAAGEAAVRVAHRMQGSDPKAIVDGMRKVIEAKIAGKMANVAKQMLDEYEAKVK